MAYSPINMPGVDRTDALVVVIARDGTVFFGPAKVRTDVLANAILEQRKQSNQRKVYIRADARAPYGAVTEVVDAIRDAGIQNIAFIVNHRNPELD